VSLRDCFLLSLPSHPPPTKTGVGIAETNQLSLRHKTETRRKEGFLNEGVP